MTGRSLRIVAAAMVLATLALPVAGRPVLAKTPDLTLVTQTTYDVRPDEGRVAVSVRITATNRLHDTTARRFYFRTAYLAVMPGTSGFEISAATGTPTVSVRRRAEDHTLLRIDLGANLAAGRSRRLSLHFQITDPGGPPDRRVRISPTIVTFEAWAFATPRTPGSSVTVTLPADYDVGVGRGPLSGPTPTDPGLQAWASGPLDRPLDFVADVAANRTSELVETTLAIPLSRGTADLVLRSWPDDPGWRERVGDLLGRALPALEARIGLPWPFETPLLIEESLALGGSPDAGFLDLTAGRLRLAYTAPDGAILEELGHAWFNGRLVADRWIADAFALSYAEDAAAALAIEPDSPDLTPELASAAVPLNAWSPGATDGPGGSATIDAYASAAGLALARQITDRVGADALSRTWAAAAAGTGAYQPPGGSEAALGPLDWRSLLDLLEEGSGTSIVDLWRRWVARPADLVALDERAAARTHLETAMARAGDWSLPRSVRDAMRAWRFDLAEELLSSADRVLTARQGLEAEAASLGLTLPDRLRTIFEGEDGFEVAEAEVEAQRAVVGAIREAREARPSEAIAGGDVSVAVGLVGVDPEAQVDAAAAALAAGDVNRAFEAAATAEDQWLAAATVGRNRIVSAGLLAISLLLLAGLIGWQRRRGANATS